MNPLPRVTWAYTRAGRSNDDGGFEPHHSASLRHNILGPPLDALQDPRSPAETPATPPPTQGQPFVQPSWIVPRLSGEAALQARNAIRDSRSVTAASIAADSAAPGSPLSPNYAEIHGPATLASPMDQDCPGSEKEWFGVAVSHPYCKTWVRIGLRRARSRLELQGATGTATKDRNDLVVDGTERCDP
ncbi:hypothetical protein F5879DRAFT_927400 [Lentinula edodes]|nr:hypothetical protein F5879DRAFT_927400 [Lentinula edodes]